MDLKELVLRIKGDSTGAVSALNNVSEGANKFGKIVKTVIAGAAVTAMVAFGKSCIDAAGESQTAETLLKSSLGNIKGMTDANKEAAVSWVNEMERSKSFDDTEVSAALQRMAIKTGDLTEAQNLTSVAMEVARNKGIELAAATDIVDQAFNGSTRALKQFGIEAGPDGETLTGMAAIDALQKKVKGSGDAWSKTLEGQKAAMDTTFGNFKETVGGVLMPIATELMEQVLPLLTQTMTWITNNMPEIQRVITGVVQGISKAFEAAGKIINGVVDSIRWVIDHAKQAIDWIKGVQSASDKALGSSGDVLSTGRYTAFGGITPHAAGGWVGLHGPEIALVGEKGPEYITPTKSDTPDSTLLRQILSELKALNTNTVYAPTRLASALNGIGRNV